MVQQHSAALKVVARGAMVDYGRRLGIVVGRTFVCDSTDELTLAFDLAVHTARDGRSRAIDRYARSVRPSPGSDEAIMLKAAQDACFRILRIEGHRAPLGLSVLDIITGETLWLIDEGLEISASIGDAFAGRLMAVDDFIMTCGATVPLGPEVLLEAARLVGRSTARDPAEVVREPNFAIALFRAAIKTGVMEGIRFLDLDDEEFDQASAA